MSTSTPFYLPRGADGRILIDDSALHDEPLATEPAAAPPPAAQAAQPAPAQPSGRRGGETPTPFGQLRPGGGDGQPASPAARRWQQALAWLATLAILAAGAYALWVGGPARIGPASAAETPIAVAAAEASPIATPAATATPAAELARAIVVYDTPNGTPVGALEPGRRYTLIVEDGDWRHLDVAGSGEVWARAWEMDGEAPPTPTAAPTARPAAPAPVASAPPRPVVPAPIVVPVGPPVTCVPVLDHDNGDRYLGDACGTTSEARQAEALLLLQQAPPPTLSGN